MTTRLLFLALLLFSAGRTTLATAAERLLSGRVTTPQRQAVDYAVVYPKGTTFRTQTDHRGQFSLKAPEGTYTLVVTALGYQTFEKQVTLRDTAAYHVTLRSADKELGEVVVSHAGISRVQQSAYNVTALDARPLHNSTKSLSEAIGQMPGLKIRQTGGTGSDTQFMLDGFTGKHVKIFIDGMPQEGVGSAFGLNNIPVNLAERIEVYKGVVPVGFGSDALGGVINIVTQQSRPRWYVDASYSYGSFNTHKSYVNAGQTLKNGLTYELNAFQNYSDNNYYVDTYVTQFLDNGFTQVDKNKIERVRRFNDTYHNEALIGKIGITGKPYADRLMVGLTYARMYKEIQTGVRQEIVFGQKHRHGYTLMPSLEYRKRNLLTPGLDVQLAANYNYNLTHQVDTSAYRYNWYGQRQYTGTRGEQSYQDNEQRNINWNATLTARYHLGEHHLLTLNHTFSTFSRDSRNLTGSSSTITDYDMAKVTRKNVSGLSYRFTPSARWNLTAFTKYYQQYNRGPVSTSSDGFGNYVNLSRTNRNLGYGAAATAFLLKELQVKLSYEKACRLPSNDELFGDEDLEAGRADLKAEQSHNYNFNLSYTLSRNRHSLYAEAGLIYRRTSDYIRRGISKYGSNYYGTYENYGRVNTKGYTLSARYSYASWFNMGASFSQMDARDGVRYLASGTAQQNLHYGMRIPNQPYRFASFDAALSWPDLLWRGTRLTLSYDGYYQHAFPLTWEGFGSAESRRTVPTQFSHNLSLTYSLAQGRYNLTLECQNLTDAKLYDNYSLQKPGRAFYGKIRICFGK